MTGEEITALAKVGPTEILERGHPISKSSTTLRKDTLWRLEAIDAGIDDFDDRIRSLIGQVSRDVAPAIDNGLLSLDVFVGIFMTDDQAGPWVSPKTSALLAEYQCDLIFDIYPPDDE